MRAWVCLFSLLLGVPANFALAAPVGPVDSARLSAHIESEMLRVPQFRVIRELAARRGLRVWLFGGTAAAYAHYAKWDLLRRDGDARFKPDRFDYDFTNIFRSTQDVDLVADGTPEQVVEFRNELAKQFPYFMGNKQQWEVRALRFAIDRKEPLLRNPDFLDQHTDSNSTGMIELTEASGEPRVRDLRAWDSPAPYFLRDVADGMLHFYFSPRHETTSRYKRGLNPPILSVVRYFTKAFQFDLKCRAEDLAALQSIINAYDPKAPVDGYVMGWLHHNGPKIFRHAVDVAYAWNVINANGLRAKLAAVATSGEGYPLAAWMEKEPLRHSEDPRRLPPPAEPGKTAAELGIELVTHETRDFVTWEAIRRSHQGIPNVFVSRRDHTQAGETAAFGDGLYTRVGKYGAARTGFHIRFRVRPEAVENVDFVWVGTGDYVLWLTRDKLEVMHESLVFSPASALRFLLDPANRDERGVREFFKTKLRSAVSVDPVELKEVERLVGELIEDPHNHKILIEEVLLNSALQASPRWNGWVNDMIVVGTAGGWLAEKVLPLRRARAAPQWMEWVGLLQKRGVSVATAVLTPLVEAGDPRWATIAHRIIAAYRSGFDEDSQRRSWDAGSLVEVLTRPAAVADEAWPGLVESLQRRAPTFFPGLLPALLTPQGMARPEWPGLMKEMVGIKRGAYEVREFGQKVFLAPSVLQRAEWMDLVRQLAETCEIGALSWVVSGLLARDEARAHPVWLALLRDIAVRVRASGDKEAWESLRFALLANPHFRERLGEIVPPEWFDEVPPPSYGTSRTQGLIEHWVFGIGRTRQRQDRDYLRVYLIPEVRKAVPWKDWLWKELREGGDLAFLVIEHVMSDPAVIRHPRFADWVDYIVSRRYYRRASSTGKLLTHVLTRPEAMEYGERWTAWVDRLSRNESIADAFLNEFLVRPEILALPGWELWATRAIDSFRTSESYRFAVPLGFLLNAEVHKHSAWERLVSRVIMRMLGDYWGPVVIEKFLFTDQARSHPDWWAWMNHFVRTARRHEVEGIREGFSSPEVRSDPVARVYLPVWEEALKIESLRQRKRFLRERVTMGCSPLLLWPRLRLGAPQ